MQKFTIITLIVIFAFCTDFSISEDYMTKDEQPESGPESPDTVYVPGTPGGNWSPEEVESTRKRILQMIHPSWKVKAEMGTSDWFYGMSDPGGECTENVLMRLVFHDCIPYVDNNDGWACDGCFNWKNMGAYTPRDRSCIHLYYY